MFNLIIEKLPQAVEVTGIEVPINTNFRTSIQVQRMIESSLDEQAIHFGILDAYFGSLQAFNDVFLHEHTKELFFAALRFARMDAFESATKSTRGSRARTFDWDVDQKRLIADFQREYRLDITDADCRLHWWRFLTLFECLSDDSATMTAIGYRAMEIPKTLPADEQKRLRKLKQAYDLPPRSTEEVLARDAAIWGE